MGCNRAAGVAIFIFSQKFLREQDLEVGDRVEIRFNVGDSEFVDVPEELQNALDDNEAASNLWADFTPGRKRGFAAMVNGAKQPATRKRRAAKMIDYMLDGKNPGGR